jgi:hypothetical protein
LGMDRGVTDEPVPSGGLRQTLSEEDMANALDFLKEVSPHSEIPQFFPCARYYAPMDLLIYLQEDLSYRADRVDEFLTLLWHPSEDRAIGVKLKGFRFLFQRLTAALAAQNVQLGDGVFVSLVAALEIAMTSLGSAVVAQAERERREQSYERARELLKTVQFDTAPMAAAA